MESEEATTNASAKKLKKGKDCEVRCVDSSFDYRILNFFAVFTAISACVKCKTCDITFKEANIRGLGSKIIQCEPTRISSCPQIDKAYEINRRFVFAMRLLGLGQSAMRKICGMMDLPKPVTQSTYDTIVRNIHTAVEAVSSILMKEAADEKKNSNSRSRNN